PVVGGDGAVELGDGPGVVARVVRIQDAAAPQHVVDGDDPTVGELGKHVFVVVAVVGLVGVDEHDVEGTVERGQRLEGRAHADLDAIAPGAGLDVTAGHRFMVTVDVQRDQLTVIRQGGRHGHRRVPGEHPD